MSERGPSPEAPLVHLCVIACPSERAAAIATCESYLQTNDGRVHLLLLDGLDVAFDHPRLVVHRATNVLGDEQLLHRLGAAFIAPRFARAIRPSFLRLVVEREGRDTVVSLPPGSFVNASLMPIHAMLGEHAYGTWPRLVEDIRNDDLVPDSADAASLSIDEDIIVVGSGSGTFLDWWHENLAHAWQFGVRGAWFRQRDWLDVPWLNAAIGVFEPAMLSDRNCGVGAWRAPSSGSEPLWYDLRGFDPDQPHLLDPRVGPMPRVLLSEHPLLADAARRYADALARAGWHARPADTEWTFGRLGSGAAMNDIMRASYIKGHVYASNFGETPPPDPFEDDGSEFVAWLRQSRRTDEERGLSRYLTTLWEFRPDLQNAMPNVDGSRESALRMIEWARAAGPEEGDVPDIVKPAGASDAPPHTADVRPGVNIAGFLSSAKGLGEAGRAVLGAIRESGVECSAYDFERTPARKEHVFADIPTATAFDTNVICINAEMMTQFAEVIGPTYFANRYNIGVWFWEAGTLNEAAQAGIDLVDEIWVTAPYVRDVFAAATDKPVQVMPLPVTAPPPSNATRADLGLPDGFLFLFVFDFFSTIERKNPIGLIKAFTSAFEPGEGPVLVLKSINGDRNRAKLEAVRHAIGDRPDIVLIDEFLPADQKSALINLCDCYVSLHRGEGFGLGMAEAMMLGKPVIGTGYSGNLAFMSDDNSFLVDYELTTIVDNDGLYPEGGTWAEPDVAHAARLMRLVHDEPVVAAERAAAGQRAVEHALHPDRLVEFVTGRLAELRDAPRPDSRHVHVASNAAPLGDVQRSSSRLRAVLKRAYWKLVGPATRRLDGHSAQRAAALYEEVVALRSTLDMLQQQMDSFAERSEAREDAILLHAHAASEYARVAARRRDPQHDA